MMQENAVSRRKFLQVAGSTLAASLLTPSTPLWAQQRKLSIATGGTGGVFYVMGGGIANILTKKMADTKVTAEATAAAVDNGKLLEVRKADMAFMPGDVAYDAYMGLGKFKNKVPIRTVLTAYGNFTHLVVAEGSGINSVKDLRGKRVSLGAPGSGTEVKAVRLLEAAGIDPAKDIKRERLSVAESAGAMKDRKVDAFNWSGGLPTAAVMDLAATPGIRIKILDLDDVIPKVREKYGPVYFSGKIPKGTYPGIDYDVKVLAVAVVISCHEKMDEKVAYEITKTILENQKDLFLVHKEAEHTTLENAVQGSPTPYHPGSLRYYKEKGVTVKQ